MGGIFVFVMKTPKTSTSTPNSSKNNKYPICHQNLEKQKTSARTKKKKKINSKTHRKCPTLEKVNPVRHT